ncbi:component of IIS longevity pathway SMK-1-domain-containing protein [Mycena belliarum]|uniref:Component of IIS longevity pathway SMK-1-domain-containing protein n=1 Tax=Mycena belliarum TaxID=1033014 RepID=A0AAD6UCU4_9AGAR|nr:component of IIS longevity pathway SMK-1-domain-containing protein [Mycena belliae]
MNVLLGQQPTHDTHHGPFGAGPADADSLPSADTLPSSSPPPPAEHDDDNPTVAPSSTISPEPPLDDPVARDDKDPPTVHTSELIRTDADEMLLDSSDPDTAADAAGGQLDDGQDWMPDGQEQEMKRVKVYELVGQRWVDQGTAFCFGQFQDDSEHAHLIARAERNYADIILSTPIRSTDVYQRQQETLIVWTEPNGADYALSFQDPEGCSEVWNFILDVQNHLRVSDERNVSSSPVVGGPDAVVRDNQLPAPRLGNIADIDRALKGITKTQPVKERLCEYIMAEEYFKALIEVLQTAEDLESIENLHALCSITQTILMLNDHNLYEHILSDDLFPGVVGMLEYDPEFPAHKANYRDFLSQTTHFHQPIPIHDVAMQRKIHHTYRLQFLKDVVLARALDDSTFNVLNSCIIFNQIDIITHVQQDYSFLREIVKLFVHEDVLSSVIPRRTVGPQQQGQPPVNGTTENQLPPNELPPTNGTTPTTSPATAKLTDSFSFAAPDDLSQEDILLRRQVVFLIQQLCAMGKNVQLPARMALFRTLVDKGLLFSVQWALSLSEKDPDSRVVIGAGGEVFAAMLDHDAYGVRGHVLKQVLAIEKERDAKKRGADKAQTLAALVCGIVAHSEDLAVQSQMGDAMKVLLDIPPPGELALPAATGPATEVSPGGLRAPRKDEVGTERFMDYFYRECVSILFKPLMDLPEWRNSTESVVPLTREETNRFTYLCDLLYNFISGHNFRGYFYVASSQILSRVPTLFKARDKHLQHAAFRIFRLILKLNNANLHTQMMKLDVIKPILELTLRESKRDNLLSCSCHEFFDFMRRENIRDMIKFCMTHHEPDIRKLAETPLGKERFILFIQRWEINNEPPPEESKSEKPLDNRWPGQGRVLDAEEEDYFNAEDEDDYIPPISGQQWVRSLVSGRGSPIPSLKRKRRISTMSGALGAFQPNLTPRTPSPSLGQLMDYGEEDDDLGAIDAELLAGSTTGSAQPLSSGPPPPPKRPSDDDDEDNMLEALVRGKSQIRPSTPTPRSGDKRRRGDDDDDDDEMLERLTKAKKPDLGSQKGAGGGMVTRSAKLGDDPPPKKLKLKFGLGSAVLAASPTMPISSPSSPDSKNGAKDGDTG